MIDVSMLTAAEVEWLNGYHKQARAPILFDSGGVEGKPRCGSAPCWKSLQQGRKNLPPCSRRLTGRAPRAAKRVCASGVGDGVSAHVRQGAGVAAAEHQAARRGGCCRERERREQGGGEGQGRRVGVTMRGCGPSRRRLASRASKRRGSPLCSPDHKRLCKHCCSSLSTQISFQESPQTIRIDKSSEKGPRRPARRLSPSWPDESV